jgi:hypothetical protein
VDALEATVSETLIQASAAQPEVLASLFDAVPLQGIERRK